MKIWFDQEDCHEKLKNEYEGDMILALTAIANSEDLPKDIEVSVSFVSPDRIRKLNSDYRDTDKVTDVLSFPQFESKDEILGIAGMTGAVELGDVVICMDRAASQAGEYGHTLKREVIYLFVHSILHLIGYDHMDGGDKKVMRRREEEIMGALGISRE